MILTMSLDEKNRVVIPKQMRKQLGVSKGDSLVCMLTDEGGVYLKKYEPQEFKNFLLVDTPAEYNVSSADKDEKPED